MPSTTQNQPWLMWGGSSPIFKRFGAGGTDTDETDGPVQLCSVKLGRPDTWSFMFFAQPIEVSGFGGGALVSVTFDLVLGVGRMTQEIRGFAGYSWNLPPDLGAKWNTAVQSPPRNPTDVPPNIVPIFVDHFPADTIQIRARVERNENPAAGAFARFQTSAWLAPRSHIRPEWF